MKKSAIGIILASIFCVLIILLFLSNKTKYENAHKWDNTYLSVTKNYNQNHICRVGNDFYYTMPDGVYRYGNKDVVQNIKEPIIYANNDILYVYSNDSITAYDIELKKIQEYKSVGNLIYFSVENNKIITFDTGKKLHIYNMSSMIEYDIPTNCRILDDGSLAFKKIDDMYIIESIIEHDNSYGEFVFENGKCIFNCRNMYAHSIAFYNEDYVIITQKTFVGAYLDKYFFREYDKIEELDLTGFKASLVDFSWDNNKLIGILSNFRHNPHDDKSELNNLKNHISDTLAFIDSNSMTIEQDYAMRKQERILYVDSDKAITFYDGEYISYSVDDWKIIKKESADEIQPGGQYLFEDYGDYIFVFQGNSSKPINRISTT